MAKQKPPDGSKIKIVFKKDNSSMAFEGRGRAVYGILIIAAAMVGYLLWIR